MFNRKELELIKRTLESDAFTKDEKVNKLKLKNIISKIDDVLLKVDNCKELLWNFHWDCGRQGELDGVFKATLEDVNRIKGYKVYFGEVLGKHSEIYGTIDEEDITLITSNSLIVISTNESGYNPFEYVNDVEFYLEGLDIDELKRFAMSCDCNLDSINSKDEVYKELIELYEGIEVEELIGAREYALSKKII